MRNARNPVRSISAPCAPSSGNPCCVGRERLPLLEQAAPVALEHLRHQPLGLERIPEAVVVDDAGQVRPGRQEGLERPLDRALERSPVDLVLHARGERHLLERADEAPRLARPPRRRPRSRSRAGRRSRGRGRARCGCSRSSSGRSPSASPPPRRSPPGRPTPGSRPWCRGSCSAGPGRRRRRCRPSPRTRRGGCASGSSAGRPASGG